MADIEERKQLLRFQAIEYLVHWEGGVNSNKLGKHLDVSLLTARKFLKEYLNIHPENLVYQPRTAEKLYIANQGFKRHCITEKWSDYLSFKRSVTKMNASAEDIPIDVSLTAPLQQVTPTIYQKVYRAIRNRCALTINYRSKSSPNGRIRLIHPHAIADNGNRYHCRAFCETNQEFKDFNLNRIIRVIHEEPSNIDSKTDHLWHECITITIKPNPKLPKELSPFVLKDYGYTKQSHFRVTVRQALLPYYLQYHQITTNLSKDNPLEKPLTVEMNDVIASLLFQTK